jgi:Flp pilus assembly protein TadD
MGKKRASGPRTGRLSVEHAGPIALLLAAAFLSYANALTAPFVFDDVPVIVKNGALEPTMANVGRALVSNRPTANLSFLLTRAIFGLDVRAYHAVNIATHAATAVALFAVLRRALVRTPLVARAAPLAAASALIFAVHPLQTESVTYVVQGTQALMGLFEILSLYFVARSHDSATPGRWQLGAVLAFLLAMGAKPHVMLLPVIVLAFERAFFVPSVSAALRRGRLLYTAFGAAWLVGSAVVVAHLVLLRNEDITTSGQTPISYGAAQCFVIPYYLGLCLLPIHLCIDYGWNSIPAAHVALGGVLVASLFGATALAWRRSPQVAFLGVFFFLNLLPISSVIPRHDLCVEHRMYLPLAAVSVAAVIAGHFVFEGFVRRFAGPDTHSSTLRVAVTFPILAVVTLALVVRTWHRNADYRTNARLWRAAVAIAPDNGRAHYNFGIALREEGDEHGALVELNRAIAIDGYPPALVARGDILVSRGRLQDAVSDFTQAIAAGRTDAEALVSEALFDRANALGALGHRDEAIADYTRAIAARPGWVEAVIFNRACAYFDTGQYELAIADFTAVLALHPDHSSAFLNRGSAHLKQGALASARRDFDRAIELAPAKPEAYFHRAIVSLQEGLREDAATDVEKGLAHGGTPPPGLVDAVKRRGPASAH